jgi:hemerythrin-like domain-containing protein
MPLRFTQPADDSFDDPLGLLRNCHRRIEYFLDVLAGAARAASGRALRPDEWKQVERALIYFETAGPRHTADEEESLFPRLRASADLHAVRALELLSHLHEEHEIVDAHHRMVNILCRRWLDHGRLSDTDARELAERLEDLQSIYREHIVIEDRIVFPAAGQLLSPRQLQDIGLEMAARRTTASGTAFQHLI